MKKIILPVVLILLIGISGIVIAQNIESKYIGKNPTPPALPD